MSEGKDIPRWFEHYCYLIQNPEIFETFFPGRHATNQGHGLHNDCIIISGKKGVGKTELAKMLMYIFSKHEKDDKFAVFCGVPDLYEDMSSILGDRFIQIDLEEIEFEGDFSVPSVQYFQNLFIIFDDTEKHESKEIEKMLWRLVNALAQKGRNFRVTLLCILHQLNRGIASSTLLREMDALIIFPNFFDMNTFNTIIRHIGIPKDIVEALYKLNNERFILIRNSAPQYFFLGTTMLKTNNYNEILKQAYGYMPGGFSNEDDDENFDVKDLLDILKDAESTGENTNNYCEKCDYKGTEQEQ